MYINLHNNNNNDNGNNNTIAGVQQLLPTRFTTIEKQNHKSPLKNAAYQRGFPGECAAHSIWL